MIFRNRAEAGRELATKLETFHGDRNALVVGLARGGVVVAVEVAKALLLPLDPLVIRKIGAPDQPELALGAVGSSGTPYYNEDLIALLGVSSEYLQIETAKQRLAVEERSQLYFSRRKAKSLEGKTVILIDDGIATGASMKLAVHLIEASHPKTVVVAVPVASTEAKQEIAREVDLLICLHTPPIFQAVGAFYKEFGEVTDQQVVQLLDQAER